MTEPPEEPAGARSITLATCFAIVAVLLALSGGFVYSGPGRLALMPFYVVEGIAIAVSSAGIRAASVGRVGVFRAMRLFVIGIAAVWILLIAVGPFMWGVF
ncbi:MAG: hypothetical protein DHS20C14_07740 [Phycisphaeraceae bacterium]|nr:MAG: hypothetical protein DHS20C14_07740 [Phycisphaeraceae bacterium]